MYACIWQCNCDGQYFYITLFCYQHGAEGRLSEKFASAMQHVSGEDVRYSFLPFAIYIHFGAYHSPKLRAKKLF